MSTYNDMDDAALVSELATQEHALVRARFALSMNRLDNTASVRVVRRDIARIKTEIRRREVAQGLSKDSILRSHRAEPVAVGGDEGAAKGGFLKGVVDKLGE